MLCCLQMYVIKMHYTIVLLLTFGVNLLYRGVVGSPREVNVFSAVTSVFVLSDEMHAKIDLML